MRKIRTVFFSFSAPFAALGCTALLESDFKQIDTTRTNSLKERTREWGNSERNLEAETRAVSLFPLLSLELPRKRRTWEKSLHISDSVNPPGCRSAEPRQCTCIHYLAIARFRLCPLNRDIRMLSMASGRWRSGREDSRPCRPRQPRRPLCPSWRRGRC